MNSGASPLLQPSDVDITEILNVNDDDCQSFAPTNPPLRALEEYTDASYQLLIAKSLLITVDVVRRSNGLNLQLNSREAIRYDLEVRALIHAAEQINDENTASGMNVWSTLQKPILLSYLRRILLNIHQCSGRNQHDLHADLC